MEFIIIQRKSINEDACKRCDRTEKAVCDRSLNDFHEFVFIVLYFVAIGSFTPDGGLLQPTGGVKTTPQKTRVRSVNLYEEFAYRSTLSKWLQRQQLN